MRINVQYAHWKKLLPWLVCAVAVLSSFWLFFRMLWFDEVLTVQLLMKLPLARIYSAYEIPNNHIVFTLAEKIWYSAAGSVLNFPYYFFRIPPMVFGAAAIFLLTRKLLKSCGIAAGAAVPAFFAVSMTYALFATGVRGYSLGFLLTVLMMFRGEKILRTPRLRDYVWYFGLCLLSAGTAPTNLAAMEAVALFFLPALMRRGVCGVRRSLFLFLSPGIALALFYLPILEKFLGCIRLGEGWHSGGAAVLNLYAVTGLIFAGFLPFCLAGAFLIWRRMPKLRWNCICGGLIFLIPAGVYCVFRTPPFPRVFFPLTAVWIFLLSYALCACLRRVRNSRNLSWAPFLLQGLVCLLIFQGHAETASRILFGQSGKQDDFLSPYYARESFKPQKILSFLNRRFKEGEDFRVFATFDADAPSLIFASSVMDFPEGVLLMDTLNRPKSLRFQDVPGPKYIISGDEADLQRTKERFGFKATQPVMESGCQRLDRVLDL